MTDEENTDTETGAENEHSDSAEKLPAQPADDDSEVGTTDQHSSSDA